MDIGPGKNTLEGWNACILPATYHNDRVDRQSAFVRSLELQIQARGNLDESELEWPQSYIDHPRGLRQSQSFVENDTMKVIDGKGSTLCSGQ